MSSINPSSPGPSDLRITLTGTERRFCDLLNAFSQTLDPPVQCRIAGGWVRDKLLSLPSNDLDIALPLPSGYTFALQFIQYIRAHTPATGEGVVAVGSVGRVAANPEQSKHLETGATRIMGLECDFVGLRSETYTDSRIPDAVKLGTPEEDALRRDLTINALFYNVATESVEDYTQRGLADLQARIARTPLAPRQTFLDDPLRVLRTIRFAGRFGLKVEEGVAEAARDTEIQAALRTKVSKERIGIEMTKSLLKSPLQALELIADLGLHSSIFTCPRLPEEQEPVREPAFIRAARTLEAVRVRWEGELAPTGMEHAWLAAALVPFEGFVVVGKKELPAVSVCVAEGLKLSTEHNKSTSNLSIAYPILASILDSSSRSEIGTALQNAAVRPWRRSVLWGASRAIEPLQDPQTGGWNEACDNELGRWKGFAKKVEEMGLEAEIDKPPIVDGKSICAILSIKPSAILTVILQAVRVWQLDHPEKGKEECEVWLKEMWAGEGKEEWESRVPAPVVVGKGKKGKGEAKEVHKDPGRDAGEKRKNRD